MASNYETFWEGSSFAVVGDSQTGNFPKLTYAGLKRLGKTVYAVDPSAPQVEGDATYPDLASLPERVDRVVLEVPKEQTQGWVERVAEAGVHDLWIHMGRETPGAVALAREKGLNLRSGTCAVMYVTPGLTYHSIHRWVMKALRKY